MQFDCWAVRGPASNFHDDVTWAIVILVLSVSLTFLGVQLGVDCI